MDWRYKMTTKTEMIQIIKAENPTLKVGTEESGYTELTGADYDAQIEEWADNRLAREAEKAETVAKKTAAEAKLAALGLTADDFKAIGL